MPAAAALPASPLLPTKLFIPVLGADLVERTRLLGTMNDTQRARLVLGFRPCRCGQDHAGDAVGPSGRRAGVLGVVGPG